jgi:MFS transporter, OFA family, oxalate/formate antiporter
MNRSLVVVGAVLNSTRAGQFYAWSVFTTNLVECRLDKNQTQVVFSVGVAVFAVVMVIAGRLMPKLRSPETYHCKCSPLRFGIYYCRPAGC